MLKRLFQVPLSAAMYSSASNTIPTNLPQPIKAADKQRLIQLSNPQDLSTLQPLSSGKDSSLKSTVRISDWSTQTSTAIEPHTTEPHTTEPHTTCSDRSPRSAKSAPRVGPHSHLPHLHLPHSNSSVPMPSSEHRQVDQLKQHIQQQRRLRQVERKLSQTLHFSTIADTAVAETAALFSAQQVALLRYDSASQSCEQRARYCQSQQSDWQPDLSITDKEFPALFQQLWQGNMLRIFPMQAETPANDTAAASIPEHEAQKWLANWPGSWLLVPIKANQSAQSAQPLLTERDLVESDPEKRNLEERDRSGNADALGYWGLMVLALPGREAWSEAATSVAHSITVTLSAAMQHAQQYHELAVANQELQKLALSDGLTCLANRRRFDEHLGDEWQRLAREKNPLSLILCDLDHFKRYNDTFGHPAGDRCLVRVARALLNSPQRPADLVARYGGEEFAIILPNTDTQGAWRIAQKIHESIRALRIDHAPENEEPYVTVTMGVSTVIPGHDNTAQMLVQASDLALYHAKQQGRNRTYINGHYNTVSEDQVMDAQPEGPDQLYLMPLEPTE